MGKLLNVRWMLGALVLIALAFGAACDDDDDGEAEPEATAEASPAEGETPEAAAEIITFEDVLEKDPSVTKTGELEWGSMFELSGAWAGFGEPTGDGVKLAVQEINDAGGVQVGDTIYTIKLIEHDTRSEVQNTIATTTELIQDDGVNVIWGPATLGEPEATVITQQNEVLHLCPCQERETTALQTVDQAHGESRWAFQTLLPFSLLIEQGARNFVEDYPDFHTFALLCVNNETSRDICGRTAEAYQAAGVELVGEEYFPVGTTDYSPFLTRLRSGDPDFLFNFDDPPNQANIIRQAIEAGVGRLHIASLPANLIEPLVGIPLTVPVTAGAAPRQHVKPTTQEAADYFDRYKEFRGGGDLPVAAFVSLMTYDYTYMLIAAMQRAGTVEDTTAIAEELEQVHFDGIAEDDLFFNSRHLAVHGTEPCTVEAGKEITCEHVPPPPEAKE